MSRVIALKFAPIYTKKKKICTTRSNTGILAGYTSAGVSYVNVNGERVSESNVKPNENPTVNPYANANAPPVPPYPSGNNNGDHHRTSYGSNLGYPPYPGSSANGYPPQSTNQAGRQPDLGYPPYPTQNRMPVPGQPVYPQNSGYPPPGNYPQQYPGYQNNYPYQNYPNQQRGYSNQPNSIYRKGAASGIIASMILVGFSGLIHFFVVTPW